MGDQEKDRLRKELDERERGEEDSFFARQNREALERLRAGGHAAPAVEARCPRCGAQLQKVDHLGVVIDCCPNQHGMWVDHSQLQVLAEREKNAWLAKVIHAMSFAKR